MTKKIIISLISIFFIIVSGVHHSHGSSHQSISLDSNSSLENLNIPDITEKFESCGLCTLLNNPINTKIKLFIITNINTSPKIQSHLYNLDSILTNFNLNRLLHNIFPTAPPVI